MNFTEMQNILFKITGRTYATQSCDKAFKSEYNKQAIQFLLKTNTECKIEFIGKQIAPSWGNQSVNTYTVTLKNSKSSYTYTFYDSISNTEKKKSLTLEFYSVLACLGSYYPESFDDFISEFGYTFDSEREYIRVKQIHLNCLDESKALRKLFNEEELRELSEIQ